MKRSANPFIRGLTGRHSLFNPADSIPHQNRELGQERWWTVAGLDIGQVHDPAALCVLSRKLRGTGQEAPLDERWKLSYCRNFPLGTDYDDLAARSLGIEPDILVYDATGGRPLIKDFQRVLAGLNHERFVRGEPTLKTRLRPVNLVSSLMREAAIRDKGIWSIPKHELVSAMNIGVQGARVLPFPEAANDFASLLNQCKNFEMRRTAKGNKQYGGTGQAHDDMTCAFGLACWFAFRFGARENPLIGLG